MDSALVRGVTDSFIDALRGGSGPALDADLAREQHGVYVALLESAGYAIEAVAADERHPDSVFVEDTAVVVGLTAVVARSGAPTRRGETPPIAAALASRFSTTTIEPPGTLDGGDVMQLAAKHHPDLIIMDIQLPEVSGVEHVKTLKADDALKDIPVLAVTAFALKGDEDKILEAGFDGYIAKPISVPHFLETVEKFIK